MEKRIVPQVYSVADFCRAHNITKPTFYQLLKAGTGPRIMKVGTRTLISIEAAEEWRREREAVAELMEPRRGRRAAPHAESSWRTRIKQAAAGGQGSAV